MADVITHMSNQDKAGAVPANKDGTQQSMIVRPEWLRLPKPGHRCPVSGLCRSYLHTLVRDGKVQTVSIRERGVVLESNPETGDWLIDFDGTKVEFERSEQADLQLAYAVSIHKSQGSEFPAVVIPLLRQHSIMLARNLIYTAITRGRKQVILVGDPSAYAMAVKNIQDSGRVTALLPRLQKLD